MRSIWMSRLGRASTILVLAGIAMAATGLGATAEAREYGYWDRWGYHHYYSHPWWSHGYYYGYAPGYYGYYGPPAVAYAQPYYYGPPSLNFSIGVP